MGNYSSAQLSDADLRPLAGKAPLDIDIDLALYKIYNINTVTETFDIDGYLTCIWTDERKAFSKDSIGVEFISYSNDRFDELIKEDIWFPPLEFINTQGKRCTDFKTLKIRYDGMIVYVERFHATFSQNMDFITFPFDQQRLSIEIEPFSHVNTEIRFTKASFGPALKGGKIECSNWFSWNPQQEITVTQGAMDSEEYNDKYSHVNFTIEVKRMAGYYIWQLLFPIVIIILTSIVIFWINDFATQVGVGFTLLLTVVAFNFYSETLLPKLPYNTFIESIIILGYVFILLSIVAVVYKNHKYPNNVEKGNRLKKMYQILYPLSFIIASAATTIYYFV